MEQTAMVAFTPSEKSRDCESGEELLESLALVVDDVPAFADDTAVDEGKVAVPRSRVDICY